MYFSNLQKICYRSRCALLKTIIKTSAAKLGRIITFREKKMNLKIDQIHLIGPVKPSKEVSEDLETVGYE